ncbi:hypothetical protein E6C60_0668 [Paenibacillus algicola]|uniref:Uncharacterized protein n=1 Tax=Paenibacillus algicola TaxID=2565926 RepID=A0A4P8XIR3_9BACL|nr:DUF3427 domain-containing protein [Paenibacillus algicola]QCT01390.1 hypothetical protein E6C60_0668 [Paenibacillus algicola]
MTIPKNINIEHVIRALDYIDMNGVPNERISTKFVLEHNSKYYPPKYVLSIANTFVNGTELSATEFSGGTEANSFLKRLGFIIIDELNDVIYTSIGDDAIRSFQKTVVDAYNTARKECGYNASVFIQLIHEHGAVKVAKDFLVKNRATTGFEKLWEKQRLDLTIEASVLLPQYKVLFTAAERRTAFERLKEYGYVIQGLLFEDNIAREIIPVFNVGEYYSRKDVYKIMNVPEAQQGGNWDTGYTRYKGDSFVFANIGTAGRTGHDHPNKFDGNDLVWYGKKGSKLSHDSIQSLINPEGSVHIFARESSDDPKFVFIGNGSVKFFADTTPVNIVWQFNDPLENHPEILSEEVDPKKTVEGAVKQVFVNVFERSPIARKKCIEHHGCYCSVCGFNFFDYYGDVGKDFIHVHHLKPLHEIREEYEVDAVEDLRPVCPNCHAMLHRRKPAYSIEELKEIILKKERAIHH